MSLPSPVLDGEPDGFTVSVELFVTLSRVARMATALGESTGIVCTLKVALAAPAWTVTTVGMDAAEMQSDESLTATPPIGAGLLNVTVPLVVCPAVTVGGVELRPVSVGQASGVRVRLAVFV